MEDLKEKIENNYLLGCIKFKGQYNLYLMPIAWWILNHEKYDLEYDPQKWESEFRGNILNVTDDKIEDFIRNIEVDKVNIDALKSSIPKVSPEFRRFIFFIDLDSKLFVNNFYDIDLESYLPDANWQCKFENPIEYLPEELSVIIVSMSII